MTKSPDAFRTISEVAEWLGTPAHVLRFWESKFSQVKPVKRAGGRRYYRPNDMLLLGGLKKVLHEDGLTIKGAQQLLREKGVKHVAGLSAPLGDEAVAIEQDEPPIEDAVQSKTISQGLPPESLTPNEVPKAPEENPELERELDPELADPAFADHGPDELGSTPIPFIHRNLDLGVDDPVPGEPDGKGRPEHFLQVAGRTIDNEGGAAEIEESVPEKPAVAPAGPLKLEELRQSLTAASKIDPRTLRDISQRLKVIRNRIADNSGPGPRV